jgi:hypothetical protein
MLFGGRPDYSGRTRYFYVTPLVEEMPSSPRTASPYGQPIRPSASPNGQPIRLSVSRYGQPIRPSASPYAQPEVVEQPQGSAEELSEAPSELSSLAVSEKYMEQVGHEHDYSWITGHLFFVHADGGRWVVRYAQPDQVDRFGGSVVLAPGVQMKNFREGDLVCVFGHLLSESRTSPALAAPLYQVDSITIVERGDP